MRKRLRPLTVEVITLPPDSDPIWRRGHRVVRLVAEYIDYDASALGVDHVP